MELVPGLPAVQDLLVEVGEYVIQSAGVLFDLFGDHLFSLRSLNSVMLPSRSSMFS